jgi:hypothetical protein
MSERDDYLRRLSEADAHIAEAERAVTEQMAQVEALRLAGKDTASGARINGIPGDACRPARSSRQHQ